MKKKRIIRTIGIWKYKKDDTYFITLSRVFKVNNGKEYLSVIPMNDVNVKFLRNGEYDNIISDRIIETKDLEFVNALYMLKEDDNERRNIDIIRKYILGENQYFLAEEYGLSNNMITKILHDMSNNVSERLYRAYLFPDYMNLKDPDVPEYERFVSVVGTIPFKAICKHISHINHTVDIDDIIYTLHSYADFYNISDIPNLGKNGINRLNNAIKLVRPDVDTSFLYN